MAQTDRIKFISFLQILGVVLVVLGHSLHEYPIDHGASTLYYTLFQTVRMPLFVFISGFLFNYTRIKSKKLKPYKEFVSGKAQRLLLPYFVLTCVTFIPRAYLSKYADDVIEPSIENLFKALIFSDNLVIVFFWFLPAIFLMLNIVYWGFKISNGKEKILYIVLILIALALNYHEEIESITFLSIGKALHLFIFFVLGTVYAAYSSYLERVLSNYFTLISAATIWIILFFIPSDSYIVHILCNLSGLCMCLSLSHTFGCKCKWIMHLEGFTYIIYLLSWYTCIASQQLLHSFTDWPWWVYTIIALLSSIYLPWSIGKALYHFAPKSKTARIMLWLLGHNPNRFKKFIKKE